MLLNLSTGVAARPRLRASAANVSGSGRSPEIMTSAPSSRFACRVSAVLTRSAKNATVPTLATASTSAAISTVSSPARQSRESIRRARPKVLTCRSVAAQRRIAARRGRRLARIKPHRALVADEPARGERQPPRAARRERDVVRDEDQRRAALAVEPEHQVRDFDAGGGVEVAGRLVGQQQLRLAGERARDRDALLLAARQLLRVVGRAPREPDAVEPARRPRRRRRARPASSSGSITFSSAVSAGSSWNDWKTKPSSRWRSAARASSSSADSAMPSSQTSPSLGRSSPARSPSSVVLPEPDAPTMATGFAGARPRS